MEAQEQRRELEEEAAEGGGREFDLQRRQPTNGSTTTVTINAGNTGFASSSPSESEQSGADFSQQLVEGGKGTKTETSVCLLETNIMKSNEKV